MYVGAGLFFLLLGGIEAAIIRIQLAVPHAHFVSPQVFNRMFTMHGTTMIFFVAMLILFGFGVYLVPLMIGARDMAFPRLNAWGFWMSAFGGLLLYFSFVGGDGLYGAGTAPDVGWWAYAPLTSRAFSPGHSTDYWTVSLLVSGFGSVATGVNVVATIFSMRCPRMTLARMPLLCWMYLVMAGLLLFTITPLTAAQLMLMIDRYLLDLRPSRGLRVNPPRFRLHLGDGAGLLAQADFWLPNYGRRHRRHRLYQHERLGSSHFYDGDGVVLERIFRAHDDGHCRTNRNQNL
jgi:cytochrome c oxidase subunit 1